VALGALAGVHGMEFSLTPLHDSAALRDRPGDLRSCADRDGYLFLRGLVDTTSVEALAAVLLEQCREKGFADGSRARPDLRPIACDDPDFVALQCVVQSSPEFIAVGDAPELLAVLESIFTREVKTRRGDLCRIAVPGHPDAATPAHQDHVYVGGSRNVWTVWLPLTDCPLALGPLAVLPGSHRGGVRPYETDGIVLSGDETWSTGDMRAGDALFFSCLTLHRSAPNLTGDRLRLSVDYRFEPGSEPG
jgi:hypothetical protein